MVRVPLVFRGVAVLLLAASTVAGQTPEPPDELPLEPWRPQSTDFLRQYSGDTQHPLLSLLVDGELTALDAAATPSKDSSSRLTPTPQKDSAKPSLTEVPPGAIEIDPLQASGGLPNDGFGGCDGLPIAGPQAPNCLPFACPPPPPCYCCQSKHRCKRQRCAPCYPPCCCNPYLGWPCAMGGYPGYCGGCSQGCGHKCRRQSCCAAPCCGYPCGGCGAGGYGYGYGGGWGGGYGGGYGGCGGFMDGCCTPYIAPPPPPPPPPCFCHKCRKKCGGCQQPCCGYPGCGYGGYGYGGGYGGDGFMDGGWGCGGPCCAPPPCPCRKCQRKCGCSYGYGYAGCGYPGWPAYPVPGWNMVEGGYNSFTNPSCFGCKRCGCGCWTHCSRCHCGHVPPYPCCAYPTVMPCSAEVGPFCGDGGFGALGGDGAFDGEFSSAPIMSGPGY